MNDGLMRAKRSPFLEKVLEKLTPHGPIIAKAMFGGFGIYFDKVIFALIVDNQLYFKVDEMTRKEFEALHSEPFIYEGKTKPIIMPYMTLPEAIFENREELPKWIENAYQASLRSKMRKKTSKPKRYNVGKKG